MADDDLNEFNMGVGHGAGRGVYGELGNQLYQQEKELQFSRKKLAESMARARKKVILPVQQLRVYPKHVTPPIRRTPSGFDRFIAFISYPMILVGAGVGLWASAGFAGWWLLAGTAAGGAVGFASPRLTILLLLLLVEVVVDLVEFALELLISLIKIGIVLALVIGGVYATYRIFS